MPDDEGQLTNTHAELAVVGAVLVATDAAAVVARLLPTLSPTHFYDVRLGTIYGAACDVVERGEVLDVVTLESELRAQDSLERVGGFDFLSQIAAEAVTTAHAGRYAELVIECALRRAMVGTAAEVTAAARDKPDARNLLGAVESRFAGLHERFPVTAEQSVRRLPDLIQEMWDLMNENAEGANLMPTGLVDLDRLLGGGLRGGQLIVVGARPSVGKTALATAIAAHCAIEVKLPVLFASLEMSPEEVMCRVAAQTAQVSLSNLMTGSLSQEEWRKVWATQEQWVDAPLLVTAHPTQTVATIGAHARRLRAAEGLGLVVVDYLQLMGGDQAAESRQVEVAAMSRGLKVLARELGVPVVALSQLNRALETRTDKRPQLADLRESGAIEQDADVVAFLWRDPEAAGTAELRVAKHRNGATDTIHLVWLGEQTRFAAAAPVTPP